MAPRLRFQNLHRLLLFLRIPPSLNLFLGVILAIPTSSIANIKTRYIDDQYGDSVTGVQPLYYAASESSAWHQGAICSACKFRPDASKTFNNSWHDSSHQATDPPSTIKFNFTGITLDVYCILPNLDSAYTSAYNLTFVLDGQPIMQTFIYDGDSSTIQYNVSVLSLTNLAQTPHTFTMIAGSTKTNTIIEFDYAKYTVDTDLLALSISSTEASTTFGISPTPAHSLSPTPTQSSTSTSGSPTSHKTTNTASATISPSSDPGKHPNHAAVIGGTIGGILLVVPVLIFIVFYCRRYKHRIRQRFFTAPYRNPDSMRIDPFYSAPPPGVDHPLVPYNRPFVEPPAKNALWRASNVMQVVQDPRAEKRAEVQRRLEEQRRAAMVEVNMLPPSPIDLADQLNGDGSTSRMSLIVHPDTKTGKKVRI
ncbi:hypothetical protein BT96DRAFT_928707 [Gymnopus androsaceus JB14]|uniref:Mid2 domain-containing protein n=1 Tax=Gymnopus androsaceus JB14 TaxID=1447944 RepID=A0A6A4GK39_9AGAR|nr:hypothetical protein BT96DRAFT_928707 [Gymnopus androsaceus JB14]